MQTWLAASVHAQRADARVRWCGCRRARGPLYCTGHALQTNLVGQSVASEKTHSTFLMDEKYPAVMPTPFSLICGPSVAHRRATPDGDGEGEGKVTRSTHVSAHAVSHAPRIAFFGTAPPCMSHVCRRLARGRGGIVRLKAHVARDPGIKEKGARTRHQREGSWNQASKRRELEP